MSKFKDLSGTKVNMLDVLYVCGRSGKRKRIMYMCKCDCGNFHIVRGENIVSGSVKSCGCLLKLNDSGKTHGLRYHPLYGVWQNMKNRCYNKNVQAYKDYGERGITVCEEWKNCFESFYKWMIGNGWKKGLEIDRKNNSGGYTPRNCRVVTKRKNLANKGVYLTSKTGYSGVTITPYNTVKCRISIEGKAKYLGSFSNVEDAVNARNEYIKTNGLSFNIQEFVPNDTPHR